MIDCAAILCDTMGKQKNHKRIKNHSKPLCKDIMLPNPAPLPATHVSLHSLEIIKEIHLLKAEGILSDFLSNIRRLKITLVYINNIAVALMGGAHTTTLRTALKKLRI